MWSLGAEITGLEYYQPHLKSDIERIQKLFDLAVAEKWNLIEVQRLQLISFSYQFRAYRSLFSIVLGNSFMCGHK